MEYGLLGENLSHSYSKIIHEKFGMYNYDLYNVSLVELENILKSRKFKGLNVTVPYKKAVLSYCDKLDSYAKKIGSVNTLVVDENGALVGYNTDYCGLKFTIERSKICLRNKKVIILGSGGTCSTAKVVCADMGASEILTVSRFKSLNYKTIYDHADAEIIINTTPVGMYPKNSEKLIDVSKFKNLSGVIDVIYNPFYTRLLLDAKKCGISIANGLPMLVAQAKASGELFKNVKLDDALIETIIKDLVLNFSNIVLIGMPGAGKTTIARLISKKFGKKFIDTDDMIEQYFKATIPEIFEKFGEEEFRNTESMILEEYGKRNGLMISTGGGVVLKSRNYTSLKQNGRIYWIERDIEKLETKNRPLSKNLCELEKIYRTRMPLYENFSDKVVENRGTPEEIAEQILEDFYENTCH